MEDVEVIIVEISDNVELGAWARARRVAEQMLLVDGRCVTPRLLAVVAGVDQRTASKVLRRLARRYGLRRHGSVYCPP